MDKIQNIFLPQITDNKGKITFIEQMNHIPFGIKKVLLYYDLRCDEIIISSANKESYLLFIALSGSFEVTVNKGNKTEKNSLYRPNNGLLVYGTGLLSLNKFSTNSVLMVLTSEVNDLNIQIKKTT